jgi:hypothetical protein
MCVCNPDRSPVGINRRKTTPTPTGFTEIVGDDFPVLHLMPSVIPLSRTACLSYRFCGASDEIAVVRTALFVRRFRCSRSEFLEARIIPKRIEHRIERSNAGVSGGFVANAAFSVFP